MTALRLRLGPPSTAPRNPAESATGHPIPDKPRGEVMQLAVVIGLCTTFFGLGLFIGCRLWNRSLRIIELAMDHAERLHPVPARGCIGCKVRP